MTVTVLSVLSSVIGVLLFGIALLTVVFSRSLRKSLDHADRVHERSQEALQSVLDRLMAKNFEEFKTFTMSEGVHGDFVRPDEEGDRPWNVPGVFKPGGGLAGGATDVGREEDDDE
jgi:hypothetical protein